ncbi:UNVERIFIED_CONTAM: hypothetical protein GTU68_063747 [Idotea baltica]|nr:hypothetical protein [Idotea baltica]
MSKCQTPIIVALDTPLLTQALRITDQLDPELCRIKIGKELFTAEGPQAVTKLVNRNFDVFLDLKFHDIPHTAAMAVKAAANLGVWMVNVHCSGGYRMLNACKEALDSFSESKPLLIGVTVLTSMEASDLHEIGIQTDIKEHVNHLAKITQKAGLDGLVCSAKEACELRKYFPEFKLITPGIRPKAYENVDDQRRILTPKQAIAAGSDYLVIGRPITQAEHPDKALMAIISELD